MNQAVCAVEPFFPVGEFTHFYQGEFQKYIENVNTDLVAQSVEECVVPTFLEYYVRPGMRIANEAGTEAVGLETGFSEDMIAMVDRIRAALTPEVWAEQKAGLAAGPFTDMGFDVQIPNGGALSPKAYFLLESQQYANQKRAVAFTQEVFCVRPVFAQNIVDAIRRINAIMLDQLKRPNVDHLTPGGEWRSKGLFVKRLDVEYEEIKEVLIQRLGMDRFIAFAHGETTAEEKEKLKDLFFMAPDPQEIEGLMNTFTNRLQELLKQEEHPVAVAAWTHMELARIHPFSDASGRTARLIMNALLVQGGFDPAIFQDDDTYTAAIERDSDERGFFASYLSGPDGPITFTQEIER